MCTGALASVAGKDKFPREALEEFTKFGLECLAQEDAKFQLRETAIQYFTEISKVLKSEMAPIFNIILEQVLKTAASEKGINYENATKKEGGFSLGSDSEDEGPCNIDINTDFIDEKSSAIHCIGNFGLNCSGLMFPHMENVCKHLEDVGFYFHENIRY